MAARFSVILFSCTLILTAGLLFSVQPMAGKMILPLLGGSASVWNTAMVFFQSSLLAGYALAHFSSRYLAPRVQAFFYIGFLALCYWALPFDIRMDDKSAGAINGPALWQLSSMALALGGPFIAVAASAPILQHWFATTKHKDAHDPYFLYAASNVGSITALLSYPFIVERFLPLAVQTDIWTYAYGAAIVLIACCALFAGRRSSDDALYEAGMQASDNQSVSWRRRGLWLLLAFIPSSLMLGVTSYITTDIASTPLLWIVPLALYLLSYILAFSRRGERLFRDVLTLQKLLFMILLPQLIGLDFGPFFAVFLHLFLFFICALVCHKNLVFLRPGKAHLTEFYLIMSVGGALGGVFNALIAPAVFVLPLEYIFALAMACILSIDVRRFKLSDYKFDLRQSGQWSPFLYFCALITGAYLLAPYSQLIPHVLAFFIVVLMAFMMNRLLLFSAAFALCMFLFPLGYVSPNIFKGALLHKERNFYGITRVFHTDKQMNVLVHGTTIHGTQSTQTIYKNIPLTYYSVEGALHDPIQYLSKLENMAMIGLGTGSGACMAPPGAHVDFYEIDPAVVDIARDSGYFTFLKDCMVDYDILLGDGRQRISRQEDGLYDLIIVDSFSSDNIPVHMITNEAVQAYLRKLRPGGILVFHISNKYLDLEPVLGGIAKANNIEALARISKGGEWKDSELTYSIVHAVVMTHDKEALTFLRDQKMWREPRRRDDLPLWTDQYSNILSVLKP